MKWLLRTCRLLVFWAYFVSLINIPFMIVWSWSGFLVSVPLVILFVVWVRFSALRDIQKRLAAKRVTQLPDYFVPALAELSRRLGIAPPQVLVIDSDAVNLGSFGFNRRHTFLVLTKGVGELPRKQVIVLLARELVSIAEYRTEFSTWLCQCLRLIDRLTGSLAVKNTIPLRVFIKEAIVWPFTIVPLWCLKLRLAPDVLDAQALQVSGVRAVHLADAFRALSIARHRFSLPLGVSERHLFLLPPRSEESAARSIFLSDSLSPRIRRLDSLWLT